METKKVKLTMVNRKERISTKTGKPFTSLGIKTEEYGDKWLSGFDNAATRNWKDGDTVEIVVESKGEYLNFKLPEVTKEDRFGASAAELKNMLTFEVIKRLDMILASNDRMYRLLEQIGGADPELIDKSFQEKIADEPEDLPPIEAYEKE